MLHSFYLKHPMKHFLIISAVLIVLGIVLFLILREPETHTRIDKAKHDTKELGHDAAEGVKDAYDATKDAVHDATR